MKILYVITGLGQGGAERVVCDLADGMVRAGHEVKIAYLTGEVLTHPVNKNIELINIKLNNVSSLPKAYLTLSKIIRSYQPDVVHSHMVHANIMMRTVRITTPIKRLISTAHSNNEGSRLRMVAYRVTHNLADLTTNVSNKATSAFENMGAVPKFSMRTMYNGIDLEKFQCYPQAKVEIAKEIEIDRKCKIILAVGRFNEAKNYPNLLKAIYLLKQEVEYPIKLLIAGDGELRTLIEGLIISLNLQSDVILLGRRNDISKLMSACDLFVLSSDNEGFALVVAEAMACECLVVATDCGGVAEVLNNPEFLVTVNNTKALMKKIAFTLRLDKNRKDTVIYQNLKHVQNNFSLENIIEKWVFLYHE